jgi:hypothetical protein
VSDQQQPRQNQSLSEISHLFLSSIRDKAGVGGAERPKRTPPTSRPADQAMEDISRDFSTPEMDALNRTTQPIGPVVAVIASHLGPRQSAKARQYAAHLAASGKRVGLIEIDASEFRLSCFEQGSATAGESHENTQTSAHLDPRQLTDAIEELNCDVDRWVVLVSNPRIPEARALLRDIQHWMLISTCDHDGVVACYRSLKGLAELGRRRLSLAVSDALCGDEADRIYRKIASVCEQFLSYPLAKGPVLGAMEGATEHVVLSWNASKDKAQLAAGVQWPILASFLSRAAAQSAQSVESDNAEPMLSQAEVQFVTGNHHEAPETEVHPSSAQAAASSASTSAHPSIPMTKSSPMSASEVIDLPDGPDAHAAVLSSVLKSSTGELVECPITPPGVSDVRLAVSRDHRVLLLAAATQGLSELGSIGRAYRWLIENRALIAMALPQLSIDAHQMPALRLLVDHADLNADVLQSILQNGAVTVQSYRKVRWGPKLGLLLEAA